MLILNKISTILCENHYYCYSYQRYNQHSYGNQLNCSLTVSIGSSLAKHQKRNLMMELVDHLDSPYSLQTQPRQFQEGEVIRVKV